MLSKNKKLEVTDYTLEEIESYIANIFKTKFSKEHLDNLSKIEINHDLEKRIFSATITNGIITLMTGIGGLKENVKPRSLYQTIVYNGKQIPVDELENFWKFIDNY